MTKNKIEYFIKYSNYILILLFFFIFIFKTIQCFSTPNSIGDEGFYLNELNRFREIGLWKSFSEGISQLWILLAYLISLITGNDLISIRIINILLLPVALYLMYSIIKEFIEDKNLLILSMLSCVFLLIATKTGTMFFLGINDPLMIIFCLSTMYFLLKYNNSWAIKDLIIASLFAGMMFWVRTFSIIILGGFIAWIFLIVLLKHPFWKNLFRAIVFCILTIIIALIPQIPSLAEKGQLAFEHKGTENHNWGEINWLTRIKRESAGSLFAYKRPSWEELDEYKRTYGDKSIPIGLIEQFKYDPKFIIDNFIVNVFFRVPYILALSIGFLFLAFLNYLRLPEKWFIDKNLGGLLLLLTSISVCCGVSIYIINYVEHRWQFMTAFSALVLGTICAANFEKKKIYNLLLISQYGFLLFMSILSVINLVS